jgi:ketosteroid isomerase-like protein
MRPLIATVGILMMLAASLAAQSKPTTADEAAVRKLYEDERAALEKKDIAVLERCFADEFVVTNPFNKFLNKQQVLDGVRADMISVNDFKRTLEYVRIYGDVAIVAGTETGVWGGKMPLSGQPVNLRITGVARKVNGQWVEIARHASMIMPTRPSEAPKP